MHRTPYFPDFSNATLPKLPWLVLTKATLMLACGIFSIAKRSSAGPLLSWTAMCLLRIAASALGHAPAESRVEFRADLPVQIQRFVSVFASRVFVGSPFALRYPVLVSSPEIKPLDHRALGLLVVGLIILAFILVRWGSYIPWSAR